ncbi:MAG: YicC/YloC family endoribonuclease [Gammaproteobacteria bacterium]
MIRSMTAFARQEAHSEWGILVWELRSVNFRYLDIASRLPEELRALEPFLREEVGARLRRGKVECTLRYKPAALPESELHFNRPLAEQIAKASREIDGLLFNPAPVSSMDVLRWPGVVQAPLPDVDALGRAAIRLLQVALDDLVATRGREGIQIGKRIAQRCDELQGIVAEIRRRSPGLVEAMRDRLAQRLVELKAELDTGRLEQEVVLFAQKIDIAEELDRLDAHVTEVRRLLNQDQPIGRQLDFLMQEMNREANTLGAKSIDTETTQASVDLKVLVEQMREQIQNLE